MALLLTDVVIRQASAPAAGRLTLWDSKTPGLQLRVTSHGTRTWSVFYRNTAGEQRRFTLGAYRTEDSDPAIVPGLTLAQARRKAAAVLRDVEAGNDPQAAKVEARATERAEARRAGATFSDIAEKWLAHGRSTKGSRAGKPWRPKTRQEFERLVRAEIIPALGDLEPEKVTKAHVRALYDRLEKRSASTAKHVLAVLKLLFAWAAEEDHVDAVPTFPRRATQSNKRTRVLEERELRAVLKALAAGVGPLTEALHLMLYTGQRRGEVLSLRWADMTEEKDGAWWTIPPERSKSARPQRVPLTQLAVDALKRQHRKTGTFAYAWPSPKGLTTTGRKSRAKGPAAAPFVTNPQKASPPRS